MSKCCLLGGKQTRRFGCCLPAPPGMAGQEPALGLPSLPPRRGPGKRRIPALRDCRAPGWSCCPVRIASSRAAVPLCFTPGRAGCGLPLRQVSPVLPCPLQGGSGLTLTLLGARQGQARPQRCRSRGRCCRDGSGVPPLPCPPPPRAGQEPAGAAGRLRGSRGAGP